MSTDVPVRPGARAQLRAALTAGRDLGGTLQELHRRYGPVVDVGRGPARYVLLFGAEANEHVLVSNAANFLWGPAMWPLEVIDGETALILSDGADHRRRRRLVQPAFSVKRIDAKVGLVLEELDRTLATWTPGRRLVAHAELRPAVRRIVLRSLFGDGLGDRATEVGELLEPALRYVQRFPRLDVDLGVNAYARAVRGVRAADAVVAAEIARRRARGVGEPDDHDVLSALLAGADDDVLDDREVLDQVRSLVAAGYDTTSAAAAWVVHALGAHPAALARVRDEVREVVGDGDPTVDHLRALPTVDGVVHEVLRLWPPGIATVREALDDFEVLGRRVPGGRRVMYSAYVTGRLHELWPEPERFDPGRWAPGMPEPVPYSFVPFGGGYRRCIGFAMATLELQLLVVRLAQRAHWTLDRPTTRPVGIATATPAGGAPIAIVRRP
jgi:hypothetical protein